MTSETLVWFDAHLFKPDDAETVVMFCPDAEPQVWIGWYDSAENDWRCATTGSSLAGGPDVTHWARMPWGPQ
jgi:hypothetical protein